MMKKKGFVFVETIIVIVVLTLGLMMVYVAFSAVSSNNKRRENYNDISYTYRTYYIEDYLTSLNLQDWVNYYLGEEVTDDSGNYVNGGKKIQEFSCDNVVLYHQQSNSSNSSSSLSDADSIAYCQSLMDKLDVKKVYITNYNINDLKKCTTTGGKILPECDKTNEDFYNKYEALYNMDQNMIYYLRTLSGKSEGNYRIIVEYEDSVKDADSTVTKVVKNGAYICPDGFEENSEGICERIINKNYFSNIKLTLNPQNDDSSSSGNGGGNTTPEEPIKVNVTFDPNGGMIAESTTTKVAHSANIDDEGNRTSNNYGNNLDNSSNPDVIEFDSDVTSFNVKITYGTESSSYDWICIYQEGQTINSSCSGSVTGKLAGRGSSDSTPKEIEKEYTITGNKAYIVFISDHSQDYYYGYYVKAVVSKPYTKEATVNSTYGSMPTPTKSNSEFIGWYTEVSGGSKVQSSSKVTKKNNHTLYAHWNDASVTVTYNANGGSLNGASSTGSVTPNSTYGELPIPTREDYEFAGWYTAETGGTRLESSSTVTATENHTIYAHWTRTQITVTFNVNGGSLSGTSSYKATINSTYGAMPTPTREDYGFLGWYTASTGGTKVESTTTVTATDNQTLYAHWNRTKITVTFNPNEGSLGDESSTKKVTINSAYGDLPTPTREDYSFAGWYTTADGGTKVESTTVVSATDNQTLYAHWTRTQITVTFNVNGGSLNGASSTSKVTIGSAYGTMPSPTREDYSFVGWYTASSGGTKVESTTTVSATEDQTLYAHWNRTKITITFNVNGGSLNGASSTLKVTIGSAYGTMPSPTQSDYIFTGWYTASSGGTKIESTTTVTATDNQTLYAHWISNKITVTFNPNGGSLNGASSTRQVTIGSTYGEMPTPTNGDLTFIGWSTAAEGGDIVEATTTVTVMENQTLYAHWGSAASEKYNVAFHPNGGTVEGETFETRIVHSANIDDEGNRTSNNYGNNLNNSSNPDVIEFDSDVTSFNVKITYGTESSSYDWVCIYQEGQTINSSCSGSVTGKLAGRGSSDSTPKEIEKEYTITGNKAYIVFISDHSQDYYYGYYVKATAIDLPKKEVTNNSTYGELPIPTISDDRYVFAGWYTAETGGTKIESSTIVNLSEDQTLYAHWQKEKINVYYDANGGTVEGETVNKVVVHSTNVDDDGNRTGNYSTNSTTYKYIKIDGAKSIHVKLKYGTQLNADYVYVYKGHVTSTSTNNNLIDMVSGVENIKEYDIDGNEATIVFKSDDYGTIFYGFYAEGTSIDYYNENKNYNSTYGELPTPIYDNSNVVFDGWYTQKEGGDKIESSTIVSSEDDQILYAHWHISNVTVNLNPVNGTVNNYTRISNHSTYINDNGIPFRHYQKYDPKKYEVSIPGVESIHISVKYQFYNSISDGCLCIFDEAHKNSTNCSESVTNSLYANTLTTAEFDIPGDKAYIYFSAISYENYNSYGWYALAINGDPVVKNYNHLDTYGTLPDAVYKNEYYEFDGWYTELEGGEKVNSSSIVNTTTNLEDNRTLYAHYNLVKTNVKLDPNGGTLSENEFPKEYDITDNYGELPTPTREHYRFDGWYTKKSSGTKIESTTPMQEIDEQTLYAHWVVAESVTTFSLNGSGAVLQNGTSPTTYPSDVAYGSLPTASRAHYSFDGWYDSSTGGTKIENTSIVPKSVNRTLYAHWTLTQVVVSLNTQDGTLPTNNFPKTYNIYETYGTLPTPTKEGYTFAGWYTTSTGGTKIESNTGVLLIENHTLYAHWYLNDATVYFNPNGGTFEGQSSSHENRYSHTSNISDDGTQSGSYANNLNTYDHIKIEGVSGLHVEITYQTESCCDYVRIYEGNVTSASSNYIAQLGGEQNTQEFDIGSNEITLYFRSDGSVTSYGYYAIISVGTNPSKEVHYNSTYGELPTPIPPSDDLIFAGWYTEKNGGEKITSESMVKLAKNQTLYAHYISNSDVNIVFNPTLGTLNGYQEKLLYSKNMDEEGNILSNYPQYNSEFKELKIPGAESIHVKLKYNMTSSSDSLCVMSNSNYSTSCSSSSGKITYSSSGFKEVEYDFEGDSVYIYYYSYTSGQKGFFAEVTAGTPTTYTRGLFENIGTLPTPTISDSTYEFDGWYTKRIGGDKITSTSKVTPDIQTLYAHWKVNKTKIIFDPGDGNVNGYRRKVLKLSNIDDLGNEIYKYPSSFYSISGNETISGAESIHVKLTYQHSNSNQYIKISDSNNTQIYKDTSLTLKTAEFDVPGEVVKTYLYSNYTSGYMYGYYAELTVGTDPSIYVNNGSAYGTLPTPTREGYTFAGWFTKAQEGELITSTSINNTNKEAQILYAKWAEN